MNIEFIKLRFKRQEWNAIELLRTKSIKSLSHLQSKTSTQVYIMVDFNVIHLSTQCSILSSSLWTFKHNPFNILVPWECKMNLNNLLQIEAWESKVETWTLKLGAWTHTWNSKILTLISSWAKLPCTFPKISSLINVYYNLIRFYMTLKRCVAMGKEFAQCEGIKSLPL
jgi:hypothetical protein